jgi:hypothetical protein
MFQYFVSKIFEAKEIEDPEGDLKKRSKTQRGNTRKTGAKFPKNLQWYLPHRRKMVFFCF